MKSTQCLRRIMLGLFLVTTGAVAAPASSDSDENPYSQLDPDGVPLAVTQGQSAKPTQADVEAAQKQQQQEAANKNWLLRAFEQQQQLHNKANGAGDQGPDLYYQLSSNKDLARLAGLPLDENPDSDSLKTGVNQPGENSAQLRKDPAAQAAAGSNPQIDLSKPLISPLDSPVVTSVSSPLPYAMTSPLASLLPQTPPAPKAEETQEIADLDTPGMVAEKKDPTANISDPDLTLDVLPGESIDDARAHQDANSKAELSLPMDADQLHRQEAAAVALPVAPKAPQTSQPAPTPVPVKPDPADDPDAPMPVSQVPQITPVRAPIANPFDFQHQ